MSDLAQKIIDTVLAVAGSGQVVNVKEFDDVEAEIDRLLEQPPQLRERLLQWLDWIEPQVSDKSFSVPEQLLFNEACALRAIEKRVGLGTQLVLDGPPYFEDNEPCGYCNRPIGQRHEVWCRQ